MQAFNAEPKYFTQIAYMAKSKMFENISPAVFACIRATSLQQHAAVYAPEGGNAGTVSTTVPLIGKIVLAFDYDPDACTLTYTIDKKPFIVAENQIWDGIGETIKGCRPNS